MSSKGTSAPPETSAANCQAASSTNAASESWSARLCMRRSFAGPSGGPARRLPACKRRGRSGGDERGRVALAGLGLAARARGVEPGLAVGAHGLDDRDERAALLRQPVLDARRNLRERLALQDALLLERAQPQRQRAGADALERSLELAKPRAPLREVADHEHRPLAADDVGGATDGAIGVRHRPRAYQRLHLLKRGALQLD